MYLAPVRPLQLAGSGPSRALLFRASSANRERAPHCGGSVPAAQAQGRRQHSSGGHELARPGAAQQGGLATRPYLPGLAIARVRPAAAHPAPQLSWVEAGQSRARGACGATSAKGPAPQIRRYAQPSPCPSPVTLAQPSPSPSPLALTDLVVGQLHELQVAGARQPRRQPACHRQGLLGGGGQVDADDTRAVADNACTGGRVSCATHRA